MQRFIDLKRSKGNYFRDVDGNVILDLHCNYGGLPLGYNHDVFVNVTIVMSNNFRLDTPSSMIDLSQTELKPAFYRQTTMLTFLDKW
jgi:4-aminobutyrate aminotransferase-like enzyme